MSPDVAGTDGRRWRRAGDVLRGHPAFVAFGIETGLVLGVLALLVTISPWPGGLVANDALAPGATGILEVMPGDGESPGGGSISSSALTSADADAIVRAVSGVMLISRVVFGSAPVTFGNRTPTIGIQAVDASYATDQQARLSHGVFFTADDAAAANRVAVLDAGAATSLFSTAQSPVGQTIQIRNLPFTVVGVLARQASSAPDALDGSVLIPFQTGQVRLFGTRALGDIRLQIVDPKQTDAIIQQIQELLRTRHQVRSGQPDGFTVTPQPAASSSAVSDLVAPSIDRLLNLSRQYACQTKRLCAPTQTL